MPQVAENTDIVERSFDRFQRVADHRFCSVHRVAFYIPCRWLICSFDNYLARSFSAIWRNGCGLPLEKARTGGARGLQVVDSTFGSPRQKPLRPLNRLRRRRTYAR